jgi:CxxC-x17-CxxC domain-containing protein
MLATYQNKYRAVCSECSIEFEIFAQVIASKPIYCQECYWKRRQLGQP